MWLERGGNLADGGSLHAEEEGVVGWLVHFLTL